MDIKAFLLRGAGRLELSLVGNSRRLAIISALCLMFSGPVRGTGTWVPVARQAPSVVQLMLLLPDGTVMAGDGGSLTWHRLTPDIHGSYVNGTWTTLASMNDTRLYYSSAVLNDGRVFVAGGEYGTGGQSGEVYDPLSNKWTRAPGSGQFFRDSISQILPNGNVLIAPVGPTPPGSTIMYNPGSNSWVAGPRLYRGPNQDEASWVRLPDDSILTIDPFGTNCERYIPSLNQWIDDTDVPVQIYDGYAFEMGAGLLLPNGKAIFFGVTGSSAIYTPTGTTSPGTWEAGPLIPNNQSPPDAPAAMMANGKILCAFSPQPTAAVNYPAPTSFYEYDYITNQFTAVGAPGGGTTRNIPSYFATMLDLPDGTVLYSEFSQQVYVYQPDGTPIASGKPAIQSIIQNSDGSYHLTGTLLSGISEGASYGDDNQMNSNYPLVRLVDGAGRVFYARTYNWSSTSLMTGGTPATTEFRLPAGLPTGGYSVSVSANGISSDPVSVTIMSWSGAVNGNWDTNTANWASAGISTNFSPGAWVIFDDSRVGTTNVVLNGTLTPGGISFSNSMADYFLDGSGRLSGGVEIVKSGTGVLTLAGTGGDDFSGGVAVNAGTVVLDDANSALTGTAVVGPKGTLLVGNNDANGNLPSAAATNNGVIIFNQIADVTVGGVLSGSGVFIKNGPNTLTLTATNPCLGEMLVNAGALALAGNGSIAMSTNINVAAGTVLSVINRTDETLSLAAGQTLQGNGLIAGDLSTAPGSITVPGANGNSIGVLTVSGDASLSGIIQIKVDAPNNLNDQLSASNITFGGTLMVTNLSAAPLLPGAVFKVFNATNYAGSFTNVLPISIGPRLAWNTDRLTVDGSLVVGYASGQTWDGIVNGAWDTTTANWWTSAGETNFSAGDSVTFDDSLTGTTNVIITTTVTPGAIMFNNSSSNYVFGGTGKLSGAISLAKYGAGTVTLAETGGDDFQGGLQVYQGTMILDWANATCLGGTYIAPGATVRVGLNDSNGSLPAGNVMNNGTLLINRGADYTLTQTLIGSGTLIQDDTNMVTVASTNVSWTGTAMVNRGTLRIGGTNALGGTNVLITVASGATLDVNGVTGTNSVVASGAGVGGNGAIVNNSGAEAVPALAYLTLTGDTAIGGTSRWDLRPMGNLPDTLTSFFAGLSTGGKPYNLTKVGPNLISIVSATVDTKLANINIQAGTLSLEGGLSGMGNPSASITVFTNATLELWQLAGDLNKIIVLNDGASILNGSGTNNIDQSVTLAGNGADCIFNIANSILALGRSVSGPGNLVKIGPGVLELESINPFKGSTQVKAGTLALAGSGSLSQSTAVVIYAGATLDASVRSDHTLQVTSGQTLRGTGRVVGSVTTVAGSTLMPGIDPGSTGAFAISGNLMLEGTCFMKLDQGGAIYDTLHAGSISYGGTLILTNLSATPLKAGRNYPLFGATNYSGTFGTISPAIPGPGLAWVTTGLTNGILGVVAIPPPVILGFNLSGAGLVISGTNAVAGHNYNLLMTMNIATPLAQWTPVFTNVPASDGSFVFTVTNAVAPDASQQFYTLQVQ